MPDGEISLHFSQGERIKNLRDQPHVFLQTDDLAVRDCQSGRFLSAV
jgi:hypothetical protein